jgi:glutathione synthase/RimK-type ligase-like ATP-grasp enzyme
MNHPAANVGASHKIEQLTTAKSLGFAVPDTIVTQNAEDLRAFFVEHDGEVIVKPMATGYVERPEGEIDSLVYTNRVTLEELNNLDDLSICPTLFQKYIHKSFDVRITVVDGDLCAVSLVAKESDGSQRCDIRRNNMDDVDYCEIDLPERVANGIRALMSHYKLRFAAIDMAVAANGEWYYFEINPNGQWAWLDECGGLNIASSFIKVFRD